MRLDFDDDNDLDLSDGDDGIFRTFATIERPRAEYVEAAVTCINAIGKIPMREFYGRLPSPGETLHIVSDGKFDAFDLVPATLAMLPGRRCERLHLSTWTTNMETSQKILRLYDSGCAGQVAVITGLYFQQHKPVVSNYLLTEIRRRGQRFASCQCHAKVILISAPPVCITVEGSANLSENSRIEQFSIANSEPLYRMHESWMEEVLGR